MRHLFKWGLGILFVLVFFHSCVYERITHMSDDELEWVTNRHEGETMYFKSQNGVIDTITIKEITIHNSLNPINWGYFNTSQKTYIATADIRYFLNNSNGGIFHIEKREIDKPISFSSVLIDGWQYDVSLKPINMWIDGVIVNDIIFFDNGDSAYINHNDSISIKNYAWSKKFGLVQYTFKDGTIFSRIL